MTRGIVKQLLLVTLLFLAFLEANCGGKKDFNKVKSPCAVTKHVKSSVVIRLVDEVNQEPSVILGDKGLLFYTLIASRIQREVVIECSSSHSPVKWTYKGVGASSGFKIVNTRWSGSDIGRPPSCYSSAIVISHVTDQLTGEYKCQEENKTRTKGPRSNSFKLFVPSTQPNYPAEGSELNVTISNDQLKHLKAPVVLPCISKKMTSQPTLYRFDNETGSIQPATYSNMRYDPFIGFIVPQRSLSFINSSRILRHECRTNDTLLLTVNLILESDEKIAPEKDVVKSSSPYLSWTTKYNPKLNFTPNIESNVLVWQQFYTKKGFEETCIDAPMFYLGSATLINQTYGSVGQVDLYDGMKSPVDGLIHKWKYLVLDEMAEQSAGLKYEDYEYFHVFICKSASDEKPVITFKDIMNDGPTGSKNVTGSYNITECPLGREYGDVGCTMLTSYVNQGEVQCVGDGVDETIRYPPLPFEAGRPFFVQRGARLSVTLETGDEKLRIPCLTNSEVATSVFLYKMIGNSYKKIWSEDDEEFGDSDTEFYPSSGFHLTQSDSGEMQDLHGQYLCSSSIDPNDQSDSVIVVVKKEIGTNFKIHPSEERVFGRIPIKFSWEADEELEVFSLSNPLRNISLGREENDPMYGFGGKTVIMEQTPEGETRSVSVRRKSDGAILHNWVFQQIDRSANHRAGLLIEMKEDKGDSVITVTCRSKTNAKPTIRYYQCLNDDTCDLMRQCHEKECHNPTIHHEDSINNNNLVENCEGEKGCSGIVIRSMYVNGILNVSCVGDGVDEYRLVKDVFFKEDIVWDTDDETSEDAYIYLSASQAVHGADQNPQREIQHIGSNIEWEMGETVEFSCVAAPFLYSNGIKWAVETKNGKMIFQKDSVFDIQFKYMGTAQVTSTFSLLIDRYEYSRVYCFVPKLGSQDDWHNASMPIFIRSETSDDYCHESNSIHLINVYPTPSKLNLVINETRLDKLPYCVVPDNVLQLAVKISGPKPFAWSFTGNGDGPTRTPLIQSDRKILDFYDSSTYCYSSRLLLNLRHKSPNDTGRYSVKHKHESKELASFYIFVPSKNPPYLLRSGSIINITMPEDDSAFYIPCLANNPNVKVGLEERDSGNNSNTEIPYDPTRGFLLIKPDSNNSSQEGPLMYRCIANKNQTDSIVVYVNPPQRIPELKYEQVNDFHVFTCKSGNNTPPEITLTEFSEDGTPVENTTEHKTTRCSAGCVALITRVNQGSVSCVGEGIDETYRFPPTFNANQRNSDKSVGLWFDNTTNSFKCQMNSVEPPTLAAVTCRRPNECEIMKRLLQGKGDVSQAKYSQCGEGCAELQVSVREMSYTAPNWFSIFLRCKGEDNMEILSQYFYDKDKMTYASIENAEKLRKIRIDVPALRRQAKMVFATFRCFANRYFYSRGIQWGLEGKNGILEFPATPASQIEVQHFSAVMSTINLEIDESIHTAVYCFVPLLDGHPAWANSTLKFPIEQLQVNI